jgi:aspartate aminotransferase-like enzyme
MTYKYGDRVLITDAGHYTGDTATVLHAYTDFITVKVGWGESLSLDLDQVRKLTKLDLALQ